MVKPDMRIGAPHWRAIRRDLDRSFRSEEREERGIIALLGEIHTATRHVFTVADVLVPEPGEVETHGLALRFTPGYLRRAHLEMRRRGLAGLATFHTHPFSTDEVGFSGYDDAQDPGLVENLNDIAPGTRLLSVVLGARSQMGRVWTSKTQCEPIEELTVVGEQYQRLPFQGTPPAPAPSVSGVFDRARVVTGGGALTLLQNMTVAVVGVSGIGSIVPELLMRAGCGQILLIDGQTAGEENLNRMLHASVEDVEKKRPKVEVLAGALRRTGLPTVIETIQGNVLDRDVLAQLRDADVIIAGLDRDWPRSALSEFAYRYLIPYIDLGTEIGTDTEGTRIVSLDARVSYVAPGRWCLRCSGYVNPKRVALECSEKSEGERVVALGYSDNLIITQPAVMDLNARAASLGSLVLRHLLQPFLAMPLPVATLENLAMLTMRKIEAPRSPHERCPTCQANPLYGIGDRGEPGGFSAEVLATRRG